MSTPLFTAPPRKSLTAYVEDEIRKALVEGRLEPGARLVTRDLAEALGVSITPVREALVRFAASGILAADPAQSFRVPSMTAEQYSEIAEIRRSVEGLAAEKAATRIAAPDIARMEALLAQYRAAKVARDQHLALRLNKEFRFTLYAAAGMPTLLGVIETLWLKTGPGFNYLYPDEHNGFLDHHNYDDLLAALRGRDAAAARAAVEKAIDDGARIVLQALGKRETAVAAAK